jgi:hypothetical protein
MNPVSTKELNYIKDFLSWELLMAKKCKEYANLETDPQDQNIFNSIGSQHLINYTDLLNYLQRHTQNQGGGMN